MQGPRRPALAEASIFLGFMNRALKGAALLVSLAIGLESATRIDEWVRWKTPLLARAGSVGELIIVDSTGGRGVPGEQYRQYAINSDGFRGPRLRPGKQRVLVVGASETFGLYERAGKEYPRQLQDTLAAAGCNVDVVNSALPGFSLPTLTATYLHRLRGLNAQLVVIYPTPVQYLDYYFPTWEPPLAARGGISSGLRLRSARRLRDHLKVALPQFVQTYLRSIQITASRASMQTGFMFDTIPADRLEAFRRDLRLLIDSAKASGSKVIVATHANSFPPGSPVDSARLVAWTKFYPRASMAVLPAFETAANRLILEEARLAGVASSDLSTAMAPLDPRTAFADFSHFSEHGSAQIAHTLATDILRAHGCPAPTHATTKAVNH